MAYKVKELPEISGIEKGLKPSETTVQELIEQHYNWTSKCWPEAPKHKYIQLGEIVIAVM